MIRPDLPLSFQALTHLKMTKCDLGHKKAGHYKKVEKNLDKKQSHQRDLSCLRRGRVAEKYSKKSGEISRSSSTTITYHKNVFELNTLYQGNSPKIGVF